MSRPRALHRSPAPASSLILAIACACPHPASAPAVGPQRDAVLESEPWPDPPPAPPAPPRPTAQSLPEGDIGLVVVNPTSREIDLHTIRLVDEAGLRGTRVLWPGYRCKTTRHLPHIVPAGGGRFTLPPPTRTYPADGCELGPPLPEGEYVVRIDSGLGAELHATATITLPMRAPVEFRIEPHTQAIPCTDLVARRAANLVLRAASGERDPIPPGLLDGCDLDQARCASAGDEPRLPPERCEISLFTAEHGAHLRLSRPAGRDALRGLTAALDHDVVSARPPQIDRTSSSVFEVAGQRAVVAGTSTGHWHVHGGDAAKIGGVVFQVHNPLDRPLAFKVVGVEFMVDNHCRRPAKVSARPALLESVPRAQLPPGESELKLRYTPQEAYQVHCDRFATRVTLEVEGVTRAVTAEHRVGRFDAAD